MALRLIEMVLREQADGDEVRELLKEQQVLEHRQVQLGDSGEVLVRILLDADQNEAVLDQLSTLCERHEANRIVILAVEATMPRAKLEHGDAAAADAGAADAGDAADADAAAADADAAQEEAPSNGAGRISREELYEDIKDAAQTSRVSLAMVVLSTVVAATGLYKNSVTTIIGAMVIAPLLGPNMALALATTLGDLHLLRRAAITAVLGIVTSVVLSTGLGWAYAVDPVAPEVVARVFVGVGDVAVALASGCAGALAFTSGVSTTLIGVMVAVALLPPLVTFGLLLGGGQPAMAMGALAFFLMNLICINLAAVATFLVQGIRPGDWREKDLAARATRIAIALWLGLLALLGGALLLIR